MVRGKLRKVEVVSQSGKLILLRYIPLLKGERRKLEVLDISCSYETKSKKNWKFKRNLGGGRLEK